MKSGKSLFAPEKEEGARQGSRGPARFLDTAKQSFREAAEHLKAGDRSARFPEGSFPPGLPFVKTRLVPVR